ncbi:MAG: alpha/beta hydrolase [Proteobacteria bacterium]|nr:alpha/beta hydrolase [Pseudomonadota bacterium]
MPALRRRDLLKSLPVALAPALIAAKAPSAGARFSVEVSGEGPDVLLIAGLAASRAVWRPAAGRVNAQGFRTHLVQVSGFAGEPAGANASGPILAPLAEALGDYVRGQDLREAAVVGHGLGAVAGLMLAARRPEQVSGLMAVEVLPWMGALFFGPQATPVEIRPQADAIRDRALDRSARDYARSAAELAPTLVRDEPAQAALVEAAIRSDRAVVARAVHELMLTDLRPELPAIGCPLHAVYGFDPLAHDPDSSALDRLYRDAYAGASNLTLSRIDGARHYPMLDQPAHFAARLDAFLA